MFDKQLEAIFSKYPKIDSVIAYGSYGRGEAALINTGTSPQLFNDIDLIIVTEDKNKIRAFLEEIKEKIRVVIGTHWVDILIWNQKDLIKKRNTIFYYDLINGSRLICGRAPTFTPISSEDISYNDIYNMYQTRMWALAYTLFKGGDSKDDKLFYYQFSKVMIAIVDFLLLSKGVYQTTLYEKEKEFIENFPKDAELHELFSSCIYYKKTLDDFCFRHLAIDSDEFKSKLLRLYNVSYREVFDTQGQQLVTTLYSECRLFTSTVMTSMKSSSTLPFKKYFARLWLSFKTNRLSSSFPNCKTRMRISSVLRLLSE